jgi:hypothetical protein
MLISLLTYFALLAHVTDPRDLIFGLLGMLDPGPQKEGIIVDYTKSVEEVFQNAMEALCRREGWPLGHYLTWSLQSANGRNFHPGYPAS